MTIEEQRYLETCRKRLKQDQLDVVTMAIDYGLQLPEIRRLVQSNQSAECMREILFGMMEGISTEALDFLCENDFNQYQIKEIREGLLKGLSFEQVKSYASKDMSANRMKIMRTQMEEAMRKQDVQSKEEDHVENYMKNLMQIMEDSIAQFQKSNERFDALATLVKEHVVDEKNREIKDLYENLNYKDKNIQELQSRIEERDKTIAKLQAQIDERGEKTETGQPVPPPAEEKQSDVQPEKQDGEALLQTPVSKFKKRMFGWLALGSDKIPQDVFGKIMDADLSTEQLEEVRKCMESGLDDKEISRVISGSPSPERMQKMREILLLMRKRRGGA